MYTNRCIIVLTNGQRLKSRYAYIFNTNFFFHHLIRVETLLLYLRGRLQIRVRRRTADDTKSNRNPNNAPRRDAHGPCTGIYLDYRLPVTTAASGHKQVLCRGVDPGWSECTSGDLTVRYNNIMTRRAPAACGRVGIIFFKSLHR